MEDLEEEMEMRDSIEDEEIMACDEWAEEALQYIHEEEECLNNHGFDVGNNVGKLHCRTVIRRIIHLELWYSTCRC